jgi:hypothetical protein
VIALTGNRCSTDSPNAGAACSKETDCGGNIGTDFCQIQAKSVGRRGVPVTNQFHSSENPLVLDVVKPDRLLVPTSKGVMESAPAAAGVDLDHFKCYRVAMPEGSQRFAVIRGVSVKDQFTQAQFPSGDKVFDLTKPSRLCFAADKNSEGVTGSAATLACYRVIGAKGQPKHRGVKGLFLSNQFGMEQADTTGEDELCVPSDVGSATGAAP